MAVNLKGRDFLKLLDFSAEEIGYFLDLAADLKDKKKKGVPHKMFEGKNIALIFEKTSTRTRCSFEVAGHDLGMGTTYLDPSGSQIGKKESIADTARVLASMYDGIEYRGYGQEIVEELAKYSKVPVTARRSSRNWQNTARFPSGTALPMSSIPPRCWLICSPSESSSAM